MLYYPSLIKTSKSPTSNQAFKKLACCIIRPRFSLKHHPMSSLHARLAGLSQRLQSITQVSDNEDRAIKVEDREVILPKFQYLCAECAWTTSTSAGALARHFIFTHASHLKCPDCRSLCENQEDLRKHYIQKHRHLCLKCQKLFPTKNQRDHHDPCERRHRVAAKSGIEISSPTKTDHPICGKAQTGVWSTQNRKSSVQSGCCPDPGCHLTFLDFNTLYEHYVKSHPICIIRHGHPKPFRCPFCSKGYQHDRFISGHVRTHKPKSLSIPGTGEVEDQENLIRQSHVAMAHRRSQSQAEAQAQAGRTRSDEEVEYSVPTIEEDSFPTFFEDGAIYIDEGVDAKTSASDPSFQITVQRYRRFLEATQIGLVLQACSADSYTSLPGNKILFEEVTLQTSALEPRFSDMVDYDDHPDRFALEENELPPTTSNSYSSILAVRLCNGIFHESLTREIVCTLQMQHFVNVSEVADLFTYFLDDYQRMYVLKEIGDINLSQDDSSIVAALHATVLKSLVDAWIDFKRLAIRYAPHLMIQANNQGTSVSQSTTWALLQYCLNLETIIHENENHIAHHFLRVLPTDNFPFPTDTSFSRIVAALAERVKNRIVHDSSNVFTNEMVLRGTRDYIKILQMMFRPLYPIATGHERLWREFRLP